MIHDPRGLDLDRIPDRPARQVAQPSTHTPEHVVDHHLAVDQHDDVRTARDIVELDRDIDLLPSPELHRRQHIDPLLTIHMHRHFPLRTIVPVPKLIEPPHHAPVLVRLDIRRRRIVHIKTDPDRVRMIRFIPSEPLSGIVKVRVGDDQPKPLRAIQILRLWNLDTHERPYRVHDPVVFFLSPLILSLLNNPAG